MHGVGETPCRDRSDSSRSTADIMRGSEVTTESPTPFLLVYSLVVLWQLQKECSMLPSYGLWKTQSANSTMLQQWETSSRCQSQSARIQRSRHDWLISGHCTMCSRRSQVCHVPATDVLDPQNLALVILFGVSFGHLADNHGRRPVYALALIGQFGFLAWTYFIGRAYRCVFHDRWVPCMML